MWFKYYQLKRLCTYNINIINKDDSHFYKKLEFFQYLTVLLLLNRILCESKTVVTPSLTLKYNSVFYSVSPKLLWKWYEENLLAVNPCKPETEQTWCQWSRCQAVVFNVALIINLSTISLSYGVFINFISMYTVWSYFL